MDNLELDLKLTVAHVNTLLKHLGQGIYSEVADLITVLHGQARGQIDAATPAAEPAPTTESEPQ